MTVVTSPYELAAAAIKQIIDTEFADLGVDTLHDQVHESLGHDRIVVGIAPNYDAPQARDENVQETWLDVRFWNLYNLQIDPEQIVDPRIITNYAERLKRAVKAANITINGQVWYFSVRRTTYPDDPTGNKSRFVMTFRAFGNNAALVETTG